MYPLKTGKALYEALASGDAETLTELWTEDFRADLSPGLPFGLGAQPFSGRDRMFAYFGEIGQHFAVAPAVDEILFASPYIIGRGNYVGHAVSTGRPVRARFVHLWEVRGDKIAGVVQTTDTAVWAAALDVS